MEELKTPPPSGTLPPGKRQLLPTAKQPYVVRYESPVRKKRPKKLRAARNAKTRVPEDFAEAWFKDHCIRWDIKTVPVSSQP